MELLASALAIPLVASIACYSPAANAADEGSVRILSPSQGSAVDYSKQPSVTLESVSTGMSVSLDCPAARYVETLPVEAEGGSATLSFPALANPAACSLSVRDSSGSLLATRSFRALGAFDVVPDSSSSHSVGYTGPVTVQSTGVAANSTQQIRVACDSGYDRTVSFSIGAAGSRTSVSLPPVSEPGACELFAHNLKAASFTVTPAVEVRVGKVTKKFYPTIKDRYLDYVDVPLTASGDVEAAVAIVDAEGEVVSGKIAQLERDVRYTFTWDGLVDSGDGRSTMGPVGKYTLLVVRSDGTGPVLATQPLEIATGFKRRQVDRRITVDQIRFRGKGNCEYGKYYTYEYYMLCAGSPKNSWLEAYGVFRTPKGMSRPRFKAYANTCPIDSPPGEAYEAKRKIGQGVYEAVVRISGNRCAEVSGFKATYTERYRV